MQVFDTETIVERCSICGAWIGLEGAPEPVVIIGGGKITVNRSGTLDNLSVMHRSCYERENP